jgi:hypothetical protein
MPFPLPPERLVMRTPKDEIVLKGALLSGRCLIAPVGSLYKL